MYTANNAAAAFDAAGSSGLVFLNSELEYASPNLVKPLSSMTHPRDIVVKAGTGGFVEFLSAYASDYGTTGGNQYGLQGTRNTDVSMVQTTINKGLWHAWNWASSFVVTVLDTKRLESAKRLGQAPPFSLNKLLEDGVQLVWNKALERVTYLGWLGQSGIINSAAVVAALAPATGTGASRTWASKTPTQIQQDINSGLLATVNQSAYSLAGMADTMLIPWTQYALLQQPMTIGAYSSVLEFVLDNNIAKKNGVDFKIFPLANPWISGQGTGATDRAVFYRNNEETLQLCIPQPCIKTLTVPTIIDTGGAYATIFNGCIGQVQWFRTQAASYLDGI